RRWRSRPPANPLGVTRVRDLAGPPLRDPVAAMRAPAPETLRPVRTRPVRTGRSGAALLYLPDAASVRLAAHSIAGRTVTVRNLVAALRAGASTLAVPPALRDRAVERALARMPALAAAVRWLEPGSRLPPGSPD